MAMHNLAVAVPLVVVAALCQGEKLEEPQGLVPGLALPVARVFGLGSKHSINTTNRRVHPVRCLGWKRHPLG